MFFTSMLFSILGSLIGYRILRSLRNDQMIERQNFYICLVLWKIAAVFCAFKCSTSQLIVIFLMVSLAPEVFFVWFAHQRRQKADEAVRLLADELMLSLKTGRGYRSSLQEILRGKSESQQWLRTLVASNGQHSVLPEWFRSRFSGQILQKILELETSANRIVDRLMSLRRSLMIESRLQRKMRTASHPAKVQGAMVMLLYFGVCSYQTFEHKDFLSSSVFWISVFLLGFGAVVATWATRRFEWQISRGI